MTTALVCIALLGLLLVGLGFAISMARGRHETLYGHSDDPTDALHKLVRAHANAGEYAGILAVMILVVGMREPATWAVWAMIVATAARYLHAAGMILCATLDSPHPLRFAGALGTYLSGFALVAAVLLSI